MTTLRAFIKNGYTGPLCRRGPAASISPQTSQWAPKKLILYQQPTRYPTFIRQRPHLLEECYQYTNSVLNYLPSKALHSPPEFEVLATLAGIQTCTKSRTITTERDVDMFMELYILHLHTLYETISERQATLCGELYTSAKPEHRLKSEITIRLGTPEEPGRGVLFVEDKRPLVAEANFEVVWELAETRSLMRPMRELDAPDDKKYKGPTSLVNKLSYVMTDEEVPFDFAVLADGEHFRLVRKEAADPTSFHPVLSISPPMALNNPKTVSVLLAPFLLADAEIPSSPLAPKNLPEWPTVPSSSQPSSVIATRPRRLFSTSAPTGYEGLLLSAYFHPPKNVSAHLNIQFLSPPDILPPQRNESLSFNEIIDSHVENTVFRGRWGCKKVVMKVAKSDEMESSLAEEADLYLSRLKGLSNVPELLGRGIIRGIEGAKMGFILMTDVGEPLRISSIDHLDDQSKSQLREVVQALADRGVFHNDLAVRNLVRSEDGDIKVVDFGMVLLS